MDKGFLYKTLLQEFTQHPIQTREDLLKFFRQYEPELNDTTFTWRVFDLKRRNLIAEVKRGVYMLSKKRVFEPPLNAGILKIRKLIDQQYDPYYYNVWDTIWLNEFTELQATSSLIVLEVGKEQIDSVFFSLKNKGFKEVFIKPDKGIVEHYVSEAKHPVIIKPFVSRSPNQLAQPDLVMIPTLEKILVDLYCDDKVYFAFQGHQLLNIYRVAAAEYALNFSTLFAYAKRRNREDEIKSLLLKVLDKDLKAIIA